MGVFLGCGVCVGVYACVVSAHTNSCFYHFPRLTWEYHIIIFHLYGFTSSNNGILSAGKTKTPVSALHCTALHTQRLTEEARQVPYKAGGCVGIRVCGGEREI